MPHDGSEPHGTAQLSLFDDHGAETRGDDGIFVLSGYYEYTRPRFRNR